MTIELYNKFNVHPSYLIWQLLYHVYDFLFVSINRLINRKSLFGPDNSHLHHAITKTFYKNPLIPIMLFLSINFIIIFFGFKISEISKLISLIMFVIGFVIFFVIRFIYSTKGTNKNIF